MAAACEAYAEEGNKKRDVRWVREEEMWRDMGTPRCYTIKLLGHLNCSVLIDTLYWIYVFMMHF